MKTQRSRRFTQGDITRAVRGVRRASCESSVVSIDINGHILVRLGGGAKAKASSWDDMLQ